MLAVVDTGPLYASLDLDDDDHQRCVDTLSRGELRLIIPVLVIAEVAYLAGTRLGPSVEARFVETLTGFDIEPPRPDEWTRIAELIDTYADFPLDTADASVVALAERVQATHVITLDRRHFTAVRPLHREHLELLP